MVTSKLGHKTISHEISVSEGGNGSLHTAGVVEERGGRREEKALQWKEERA